MPEQSDLFDLNKKHLIGRLVTSTVSRGKIADISLPSENQFRHMLVLSAADFGANGCVRIMDEELPFFARDEVSYKGQPVLAVFGYEAEDVELFCREVKVSYQIRQDSEDYDGKQYGAPFIWSYGNTDDYFNEKAKVFKSSFEVDPFSNTMLGDQKVFAVQKDGRINIRVATQWPTHLRKTIAQNLGCELSDIVIHPQPYYAPYDQLVVLPSILATVAALAAIQSGELVQFSSPMVSWQPRMKITHETAFLPDGTLLADRAHCIVDLGAFPYFSQEVCHSILAGLVSNYPMKAADVNISITRSSTPPANFFGDLGFSMALAGTEQHFSRLAISIGMQPGIWRLNRVSNVPAKGFPLSQSVRSSTDFNKLGPTIKAVIDESWYSRKYSSNAQAHLKSVKMNPLVNYSRGIGIASGESIMGFSQHINASGKFSLSVTMNEDETLVVNTGIIADRSMAAIWKDTIRKIIDIPAEDIFFMDINNPAILELGPSVLSRKVGIVSSLLMRACSELERKRAFSRLPLTITSEYEAELTDPFFFSASLGSVVIDLHIDTIMLSPIIDNIWVNFHLGHVFDKEKLLNKARHTITTVLSDICPRSSAKCNMYIDFDQQGDFTASSMTSGLRGLTTAALIGALSQALGHQIYKIPVTSDDILGIARKNTSFGESVFSVTGGEK
jgi:CO/xanthine dehydrogenase Mo-binding subunit